MNAPPPRRDPSAPRAIFLQDFLRRPRQVGSIVPSSRFLERRVVRQAQVQDARTVVELGPGTGGTTRALLRAMDREARLLVIEINPRFGELIRNSLDDARLTVHVGDACAVAEALSNYELPPPDVVLSGIPFSMMPRERGLAIVRAIHGCLSPRGRFVAYQLRDRVESLGREVFGHADVETELLNVPPMRIFRWDKDQPVEAS